MIWEFAKQHTSLTYSATTIIIAMIKRLQIGYPICEVICYLTAIFVCNALIINRYAPGNIKCALITQIINNIIWLFVDLPIFDLYYVKLDVIVRLNLISIACTNDLYIFLYEVF